MALETQKQYNEVVASTYKLLCNLLAGEPQSQWDHIVREMHERDSWADVDGKRHDEKHPKTWTSFQECVELHKLTVFTHDAAERQKCYIQMTVRKPQRATVREFISHVETLNGQRSLKVPANSEEQPHGCCDHQKGKCPIWICQSSIDSTGGCTDHVVEPVQEPNARHGAGFTTPTACRSGEH